MTSSNKFLWKKERARSFVEGWLSGAALLAILMQPIATAPSLVVSAFFILVIAIGDSVAALRLKLSLQEISKQRIAREALWSLTFASGLFGVIMVELSLFGQLGLSLKCYYGTAGFALFILLIAPGFMVMRALSALWLYWDHLRRVSIVWGLTHAILMISGVMGAVVLLGSVIYKTGYDASTFNGLPLDEVLTRLVIWSLTLFIITLMAAAAGIAMFLLPAVAFSYFVARRLTRRLDRLISAAKILESGDLSARVNVEGEDEVAMLQRTFNSMAENLQVSTAALESEKEKVSSLLQTQQELTAGVSHELRTPAAVISGYLESLRSHWKNSPPEMIDRDLETVSNEAGRLKNILNDLLDLSQFKANRLSVHRQPVPLDDILQHTLHVFQPLAWESKRVEVTAEIPADVPAVYADPTRLQQVLLNLVQNGLRHTSPGGLVAISAEVSSEWVQVNVEDTGEGISPQDLPHIWEKFYRGNGQEEIPREGGAGLGLAIVKEFVEAMGGQVSVQSCPGQGSVFSIRLQIAKE